MGPDTLTTTRENQTFSSVTPPWEMVRAPIYESGACSFRVAGVRSVLGAVLRQLQSALLVFGKVVLGTISHPLGEKKSVRLAARQLNAFRRVSEMGIKPMNSAAWRAGAPPTGMCRHRRATAAPCKIPRMPFVLQQKMLDGGKRRSLCHKSAAGFPWKSVDGSQALEKFLVFRLFADRVNVGGDDPNRHPAFCAGNQQVDNQFMMRRLLPGKGEKADQQLRIQQIPFEIGEPEARR